MGVFKCKMCGGSLQVQEGAAVCECEYCGSMQSIPTNTDENVRTLFNRANVLRMKAEFDKAEETYEKIVQMSPNEAEAYWGLILCKYGVEYVEDSKTMKRVPTCHRTSYNAIVADEDYKNAVQYAEPAQRNLYEEEAKAIDLIQKGILAISQKEEPYDVFICYKETDENGKRTPDSVIANDIYYHLTEAGYKVFYAAITLEDKLGSEYEPYIFSALNTSKVMLVLGTKPEYFNAVWVKNEWSRFLSAMKNDRAKLLIPCYKDMDAYELPEEFAHLQAQDMSKIGFINDVIRGIKKVIVTSDDNNAIDGNKTTEDATTGIVPLLKRAEMFLEDKDWKRTDEFCEQVLNIDPENPQAYLYKLMAELHVSKRSDLKNCEEPFTNNNNYKKVIRFADQELHDELTADIAFIEERNEAERKRKKELEEIEKKNSTYQTAMQLFQKDDIGSIESAIRMLKSISGWKDSDEWIPKMSERLIIVRKQEQELKEKQQREAELEAQYYQKYSASRRVRDDYSRKLTAVQKALTEKINSAAKLMNVSRDGIKSRGIFGLTGGIISILMGLGMIYAAPEIKILGIFCMIAGALAAWGSTDAFSRNKEITELEAEKAKLEKILNDMEPIPSLDEFMKESLKTINK